MSALVAEAGVWAAAAASEIGWVRRRNEDAFALAPERGVFLVADGLGGHAAGDVASRTARDAALNRLRAEDALDAERAEAALARAVEAANRAVRAAARSPACYGMGTTLSILWLDAAGARGAFAHVGDSRIYRLDGDGLRQITDDHTVAMERVRAGLIDAEAARLGPGWNRLTRAVGLYDALAVDAAAFDCAAAEGFLLCTDGLTDMLDDAAIAKALRAAAPDPEAALKRLIDGALAAGGVDNVTAIVLFARRG